MAVLILGRRSAHQGLAVAWALGLEVTFRVLLMRPKRGHNAQLSPGALQPSLIWDRRGDSSTSSQTTACGYPVHKMCTTWAHKI